VCLSIQSGWRLADLYLGPEDVQLFTALGKNHAWDVPLFLGDPELKVVEEAWKALDKIVAEA
jgi:hypothetical protein